MTVNAKDHGFTRDLQGRLRPQAAGGPNRKRCPHCREIMSQDPANKGKFTCTCGTQSSNSKF